MNAGHGGLYPEAALYRPEELVTFDVGDQLALPVLACAERLCLARAEGLISFDTQHTRLQAV